MASAPLPATILMGTTPFQGRLGRPRRSRHRLRAKVALSGGPDGPVGPRPCAFQERRHAH
eukprot:7074771-Alexandrium_andersonii.AAC.1